MNESQPITTPTDALVGEQPTTTYPDRYVGLISSGEYADSFVIMLAGSLSQAMGMMTDQFTIYSNWELVHWSRFVNYDLSYLIGYSRLYSVGNDETAWKRGNPIHTISELMEACK